MKKQKKKKFFLFFYEVLNQCLRAHLGLFVPLHVPITHGGLFPISEIAMENNHNFTTKSQSVRGGIVVVSPFLLSSAGFEATQFVSHATHLPL